jgi:hypothetical protein
LPWFHRASPSTTLDETVDHLSTDADRLIDDLRRVKWIFGTPHASDPDAASAW